MNVQNPWNATDIDAALPAGVHRVVSGIGREGAVAPLLRPIPVAPRCQKGELFYRGVQSVLDCNLSQLVNFEMSC